MTANAIAIMISTPQLPGGSAGPPPSFSLPFADAGAGAVNLALAIGTGSATETRSTSATCWSSAGLLLTVAPGIARSTYSPLTGLLYWGYLPENAATNLCLQNRDLTQIANWTATTATVLKDQVGIDGAANSASSILATAPGASVLQIITEAATLSALSMFIKRITGTGTITIQQGATTLDVTAAVAAGAGAYVQVVLSGTVLNPAIGIVLGSSADKIAVDYVQFENSTLNSGPTSPIATTAAPVTRNADQLTYPTSGNMNGTEGTFAASIFVPFANTVANEYCADLAGSRPPAFISTGGNLSLADGTGTRTGPACPAGTAHKIASTWDAVGSQVFVYVDGVNNGALAFDGDMNIAANVNIGGNSGTTQRLSGGIKNLRFWQTPLSPSQVAVL